MEELRIIRDNINRAWDRDNNIMIYGDGIILFCGIIVELKRYNVAGGTYKFKIEHQCNGDIMHCTNDKDIESSLIYEGDIWVVYSKENKDKELERIIISMDNLKKPLYNEWRAAQGKVIGNIYENKSLILEKK